MEQIYCLGFLFDQGLQNVWLLRKNRPEAQNGYLNGVGGKCNFGEIARDAMVRESTEGIGFRGSWNLMGVVEYLKNVKVYLFWAISDYEAQSLTDEKVYKIPTKDINFGRTDLVGDVSLFIHMAQHNVFYRDNRYHHIFISDT